MKNKEENTYQGVLIATYSSDHNFVDFMNGNNKVYYVYDWDETVVIDCSIHVFESSQFDLLLLKYL